MTKNFKKLLTQLQGIAHLYESNVANQKLDLLKQLSACAFANADDLLTYYHLLLFICTYPDNMAICGKAEKELKRIAGHAKMLKATGNPLPENEGLPYAEIITRFSPNFLQWLLENEDIKVEFDSFYQPELPLNDILKATLPSLLKPETTAGLSNEELLEVLGIKPSDYASFLMGQLDALKRNPELREMINERMMLYIKLVPKSEKFSLAYNRIRIQQTFYHDQLLKKLDALQMINEPLAAIEDDKINKEEIYKVVRNAMALTVREIDPATFLNIDTIKMFDVGRGVQLALYSMIPEYQLPLETYFGFTFFKNGFPVSYGGIWAFGPSCKLGLNVFEPYRLGESAFLLTQLMRVCKQELGCTYFEIEPSQFGHNNPDGIKSGAFWFYHKFGFRPVEKELKQLAEQEHQKIRTRKNYRSSEKTLVRFTEANIAANIAGNKVPLRAIDVMTKVLVYMKKGWTKNYLPAKSKAIDEFCNTTKIFRAELSHIQLKTLEETALWAAATKVSNPKKLALMKEMVFAKTDDDLLYQKLLLEFFALDFEEAY